MSIKKLFFSLFLLFATCSLALAGSLREVVLFGDSLSDNGNLYKMTLKIMPKDPPYYAGRFADGPVWTDHLERHFLVNHNIPLKNYAVGGATVKLRSPLDGNLPYALGGQIYYYYLHTLWQDRSKTLFMIWLGANDYTAGATNVYVQTEEVIKVMASNIEDLISHGAQHFFIVNLPDLSLTPYALVRPAEFREGLKQLSKEHNRKLALMIAEFRRKYPQFEFIEFDVETFMYDLVANIQKYNEKYHENFKNITEACWVGGYTLQQSAHAQAALRAELKAVMPLGKAEETAQYITQTPSLMEAYNVAAAYRRGLAPCDHPGEYLFWDSLHPTAPLHRIAAALAIDTLAAAKVIG